MISIRIPGRMANSFLILSGVGTGKGGKSISPIFFIARRCETNHTVHLVVIIEYRIISMKNFVECKVYKIVRKRINERERERNEIEVFNKKKKKNNN